jgi:hypothetical protein
LVITIPNHLAVAIDEQAKRRGVSPEVLALAYLAHFPSETRHF